MNSYAYVWLLISIFVATELCTAGLPGDVRLRAKLMMKYKSKLESRFFCIAEISLRL